MKLVNADVGDAELRRLYDVWNLAMAPAEGHEIDVVDKNMRILNLMRSFLKSMPAVDAAPVVRCRECAFLNRPPCPARDTETGTTKNCVGYCGAGEKKGGDLHA